VFAENFRKGFVVECACRGFLKCYDGTIDEHEEICNVIDRYWRVELLCN